MDEIKKLFEGKDDLWKQIAEVLGDKKLVVDDGKLIPKHRFDEVLEKSKTLQKQVDEFVSDKQSAIDMAVKDYQAQIKEMTEKLKGFEGITGVTDELKAKLQEVQIQADSKMKELTDAQEAAKVEYEKTIAQKTKDFMLENALIKAGARKTRAVMALLDDEKISVDGENLVGFEDQVKLLQASDPYLFGQVVIDGTLTSVIDGRNPKGDFVLDDVDNWDDATIQARMPEILEKMKTN